MKFRVLTIILCVVLLLPCVAQGKSRHPGGKKKYFKLSGLAFTPQDSDIGFQATPESTVVSLPNRDFTFETGTGFSAGFGFNTDNFLNTEIEFTGRWGSLDQLKAPTGNFNQEGDLRSFSFMLNIPYMFHNRTRWTPYIGGGIGMNWQRGEIDALPDGSAAASTGEQLTFAYQIIAGVGYAVTKRWELIAGYRFFGTIDAQLGTLQLQNNSHNIEVGVRWYLPEKIKKTRKVKRKKIRRKSKRTSKKGKRGKERR